MPDRSESRKDGRLPIIYRDERWVAVAKPSGLAVHRGWAPDRDVALARVRDQLGQRVYPVHRLDRPTSGVLLFALDSEMAGLIQQRFVAGEVDKRYWGLVRGIPPESVVIDHPVPKERKSKERVSAVTEVRRLAIFERYALVEARPRTGRSHQIRRHLKHRSWPLIGDVHYGKGEHNRYFREHFGLHRLVLHAHRLAFAHPLSGQRVEILAPLPSDLVGPFTAMGFDRLPGLGFRTVQRRPEDQLARIEPTDSQPVGSGLGSGPRTAAGGLVEGEA